MSSGGKGSKEKDVWCLGGAECCHVLQFMSNNSATPAWLPHPSAMLVLSPQHGGQWRWRRDRAHGQCNHVFLFSTYRSPGPLCSWNAREFSLGNLEGLEWKSTGDFPERNFFFSLWHLLTCLSLRSFYFFSCQFLLANRVVFTSHSWFHSLLKNDSCAHPCVVWFLCDTKGTFSTYCLRSPQNYVSIPSMWPECDQLDSWLWWLGHSTWKILFSLCPWRQAPGSQSLSMACVWVFPRSKLCRHMGEKNRWFYFYRMPSQTSSSDLKS